MSIKLEKIKKNSDLRVPISFSKIEEECIEDDGEVNLLDGYLTYDMNEFNEMLGENLDFDMDDSDDSDKDHLEDYEDNETKRATTHTYNTSLEPGSMQISQVQNNLQKCKFIKCSLQKQKNCTIRPQCNQLDPAEGDEESFDDQQVEGNSEFRQASDEDDEDLNFFDSMNEDSEKTNSQFLIKYPNNDFPLNLFCTKAGEYNPEMGGNQIILRNSELLTDDLGKMDEFYQFIQELDFQKQDSMDSQDNIAMQLQLSALQRLGQQFQMMRKMQQKWLEIQPSHTFSKRLQSFSLQLDRFSQSIKLIQESFCFCRHGRRITPLRTEFYFTDPDRQKNLTKKKDEQEKNKNQEDDDEINQNQDKPPESTQLCVAFFRGLELYKQFNMFQHLRIGCEKFQQLQNSQARIKSRIKISHILKNVTIISKKNKKSKYQESIDLNSEQNAMRNILDNSNQKKIQGLRFYFQNELNKKTPNQWWEDKILYKEKQQSKKNRFSSNQYLQINLSQNDEFIHYNYQ